MKNQARFIQEIIDGDLVVGKKKKAILVKELRDRKYEAFPLIKNNNTKKTPEEEEEDEDEEGEESARDFDYLLSVSFLTMNPSIACIVLLSFLMQSSSRCQFGR